MTETDPDVIAYYERGREARRLTDMCVLERVRTEALLHRYLPPPPATVLDVGGGRASMRVRLQTPATRFASSIPGRSTLSKRRNSHTAASLPSWGTPATSQHPARRRTRYFYWDPSTTFQRQPTGEPSSGKRGECAAPAAR